MSTKEQRAGVRLSVWVLSACLAGGCAGAVYLTLSYEPTPRRVRANEPDDARGARAHRRPRGRSEHRRSAAAAAHGGGYRRHDWGRESELNRAIALALPGPTFWRDVAERGPPRDDPQLAAMWRSFHHRVPADGDAPTLPFEPTAHRARLVQATGDVAGSPDSCDVRILPVDAGRFSCVVRVMCDGRVLYPNARQTAGYVSCEIEDGIPVRAVDDGWTTRDGDPLVDLDLTNGTVRVEDYDAAGRPTYSATLRISS